MDIEKGELRIVKGRRKNLLISKIGIAFLTTVVGLLVAVVIWKLTHKDTGLLTLGAHESLPPAGDVGGTTWYGILIFCARLLLFPVLMLGPRNVKLVLQITFDTFRNIYRNINPMRQILFFGFIMFSVLVNGLLIIGTSEMSLSIIQYPLHLRSFEDPTLYLPDDRIKYYNHDEPPYIISNVTRYNTEDVLLKCQFSVSSNTDETAPLIMQSLYWTKDNGSRITETNKIHINTTVRNNSLFEFLIQSVLTIELIDDEDYGTYSCKYLVNLNEATIWPATGENGPSIVFLDLYQPSFYTYDPSEIPLGKMELMDLTEITNSVFHLEKQEMPVKTARVSPGGIFIDHVPYWSLADPGDITFNTTISGRDNADCCWLPARLYKYFFGYEHLVWRGKTEEQHQRYLITQQCVCVEDLVLNNSTIAFVRTRYNSVTKQQEKFKVGHPRQVIFIPAFPHVFRLHPIIGELMWLSGDYQNCAITSDSSAVCQARFQLNNDLFSESTIMFLDVFNWIFSFTSAIVILGMCGFVTRGWIHHILLPAQKLMLDPPPKTEDYTYDFYLMYDEEDSYEKKMAKTLRESLEGPMISVFDPWKDILPGHLVPTEQERAIEKSRTFCVIISNSSENNDEQNFELVVIKKTLAARAVPGTDINDHIFTIKIGDCKVDSFLSPVKATVPLNAKEANELDQDVLHTFSVWTLASKALWIKIKRGGVVGAQQRFQPLVKPMYKYTFFFACHLLIYLYFIWVSALDLPYEIINKIRQVYYEAE